MQTKLSQVRTHLYPHPEAFCNTLYGVGTVLQIVLFCSAPKPYLLLTLS